MTENYTASATVIGRELGKNRIEMTKELLEHGLITGEPGARVLTEKGKEIGGLVKSWENGYGGYAARGYDYFVWDRNALMEELKKPVEKVKLPPVAVKEPASLTSVQPQRALSLSVKGNFLSQHKTAIIVGCALLIAGGIAIYLLTKDSESPEDSKHNSD